jgi:hypothetical protein
LLTRVLGFDCDPEQAEGLNQCVGLGWLRRVHDQALVLYQSYWAFEIGWINTGLLELVVLGRHRCSGVNELLARVSYPNKYAAYVFLGFGLDPFRHLL